MRFIHVADVHLDSKLNTHFSKEKARERNHEILNTFIDMVEYAVFNSIKHILISGDLFDSDKVSVLTVTAVENLVISNPDIHFYYLKGNHDRKIINNTDCSCLFKEAVPVNFHTFELSWTCYPVEDNICIWGMELSSSQEVNDMSLLSFVPDPEKINIVMLHGQESDGASGGNKDNINFKNLYYKSIKYLALGHVHEPKLGILDTEGSYYCYPGCLEGRGFDEVGEHGFMDVTIDESTGIVTPSFIHFAKRDICESFVSVNESDNTFDVVKRIKEAIKDIPSKDMLKVVLTGSTSINNDVDEQYIIDTFSNAFYLFKIKNETSLYIPREEYINDESLKGEFVRTVMNSEMDESMKNEVIKLGINALRGGLN